ncbi:MAG: malonyl-CoA synthase [Acidobacteria bacterium]|nr:MAG: malonyl-CoA synthase [Acidobacteriota bacterium]REK08596.1 MAG: malonyl-CoA synthase [Acidobacteriota bacterium]
MVTSLLPRSDVAAASVDEPADESGAGSRPALVLPDDRRWSYGQLAARAAWHRQRLEADGVTPGDRVLVQVQKSPDAVAAYLGVLAAGAVFVPLNSGYTDVEVAVFAADCAPRLLLCDPQRHRAIEAVAEPLGIATRPLGAASWSAPAPAADRRLEIEERGDDDLAAIVYTSGTTGRSKGAMVSHGNLRVNAEALVAAWAIRADDVLVHALPIFHVHGLFVALHTLLMARGQVLFLPRFEAAAVRAALPGATLLMGVPTFYTRLLAEPGFGAEECSSMRLFVSGSAPLLASTHREFTARTGHRILERYGMSETGMITSNPLDGERTPGTVGFALPGVEVRVVGDDGAAALTGEVGEVEVRGANVFGGYWAMPEKNATEFRPDGFFRTGDLGSLDGDGRLTLVGRSKDLVISGGYNIHPKEIEQVLDGVEGVAESAVIGVPHDDLGEGVVAVLVAEGEAVDRVLLQAALDESLARFKHPRRFYWLDRLPRNAMGKVQKNLLRERYRDAYRNPG